MLHRSKVISEIRRKEKKLKGTLVTSERERERDSEGRTRQALEKKRKITDHGLKVSGENFFEEEKKKERIVKDCGLIGMKKKKGWIYTIVFEIREYRFRCDIVRITIRSGCT